MSTLGTANKTLLDAGSSGDSATATATEKDINQKIDSYYDEYAEAMTTRKAHNDKVRKEISATFTAEEAIEFMIKDIPKNYWNGKEAGKRLDELSSDGLIIQGRREKWYDWETFVKDILYIENVKAYLKEQEQLNTWRFYLEVYNQDQELVSVAEAYETKEKFGIPFNKFKTIYDNWRSATWGYLTDQIGRWERFQDGWNEFWSEAGETVGGATQGLTSGFLDGLGIDIGKYLLIGGLVIVGLLLFVSSDRGTKTAENVGTATSGVRGGT